MICAHQAIALSIAEKKNNGVEIPAIEKYVINRDKIIEDDINYYSVKDAKPNTIQTFGNYIQYYKVTPIHEPATFSPDPEINEIYLKR
jgi:hypothetical protein